MVVDDAGSGSARKLLEAVSSTDDDGSFRTRRGWINDEAMEESESEPEEVDAIGSARDAMAVTVDSSELRCWALGVGVVDDLPASSIEQRA